MAREELYPEGIAIVLPAGFVTGGAIEVGFLKALDDTGLLPKVKFISASSVGAFNGVMAATGRVKELEEFWLSLKPEDLFRRRSLIELGLSHAAVAIAEQLEVLERKRFGALVTPASRHFRKFLRNPYLHINAFNDFVIEETVKEKVDLQLFGREVLGGPVKLVVVVTNITTWLPEVYIFGGGMSHRMVNGDLPEPFDPQYMVDIIFASGSSPVFFPPRQIGDQWYCDGAILKPDPFSYAFDSGCNLVITLTLQRMKDPRPLITMGDTIERVNEIEQLERRLRERKVAAEKSKDVETLQSLRRNMNAAAEHFIEDEELCRKLKSAIADTLLKARFSFRNDQVIERIIDIAPSWEPSIEVKLYGGYGDFSLIPQIIDRGYKETLRMLRYKKVI